MGNNLIEATVGIFTFFKRILFAPKEAFGGILNNSPVASSIAWFLPLLVFQPIILALLLAFVNSVSPVKLTIGLENLFAFGVLLSLVLLVKDYLAVGFFSVIVLLVTKLWLKKQQKFSPIYVAELYLQGFGEVLAIVFMAFFAMAGSFAGEMVLQFLMVPQLLVFIYTVYLQTVAISKAVDTSQTNAFMIWLFSTIIYVVIALGLVVSLIIGMGGGIKL